MHFYLKGAYPEQDATYEPIIKIWGSSDDNWLESNATLPTTPTTTIITDTNTEGLDPNKLDPTQFIMKEYDVTSFVQSQLGPSDKLATFIVGGKTADDFVGDPNSYIYSYLAIPDHTATGGSANKIPELVITYSSNSAPTQINLDNDTVNENAAIGTVIGELSTVDPDPDETTAYEIVSGDTDAFAIQENKRLITNKIFDYESTPSYSVRIRVTDKSNNTYEQTFPITIIDVNEAPSGSIAINDGSPTSQSSSVTLNLTANDPEGDSVEVQFSEDNDTWGSWESFAETKGYTFSEDGMKTIYMRLRDASHLTSPVYSDTILVDTVAPEGTLQINNGEGITNSSNVILHLTGSDAHGPLQVRITENGISTLWESFPVTETYSLTLSAGDGIKTIRMELKDTAGNVTEISKSITLDKTPPVITLNGASAMSIQRGSTYTELGATVTDNLAPNLSATMTGSVDTSAEGTYTLTYGATDLTARQLIAR